MSLPNISLLLSFPLYTVYAVSSSFSETMAIVACAAVLLIVACGSEGYKEGPPIKEDSSICVSLYPVGHGADPKTSPPPFKIDVSDTCTTKDPIFG